MASSSLRSLAPSPLYPTPSPARFERLLWTWERLRELNIEGYRTSSAVPASTWLVQIHWADSRRCGRSVGRGTTCSPFVTQATAMLYSSAQEDPYAPVLADGRPLPIVFSHAANSVLNPKHRHHQDLMARYGMSLSVNEWPRPIVFFNMGYAVEPTQMRRGDAVHIDWMNGGGHAVFCWDVHLNERGEVDAFQYVSSNGSMSNGGDGGGISVGGTSRGAGGFIGRKDGAYSALKTPLFVDDEAYVREGAWVTWDDEVAGKPLPHLRCPAKSLPKRVRRVSVARFHGIDPSQIPLFAMGEDQPGQGILRDRIQPETQPSVDGKTEPTARPELSPKTIQRRLKLLHLVGWLKADVGKVDGKIGAKTTAAVLEFQRAQGLRRDGKVGRITAARLEAVFRSACDAPAAKKYLSPKKPGGLRFAAVDWQDEARLYFRQGVARSGEAVEIILCGEDLPQRTLLLQLYAPDSERPISGGDIELDVLGGRASVRVELPTLFSDTRIVARVRDFELETAAPLLVLAS